jgi:outer membrane protein OmpA-like peptidoglycan-associated protein
MAAERADDEWNPEVGRAGSDQVRWVQSSLNRILGLKLAVDGVMGPKTRSAIRSFQRKQGLAADGVVGPKTTRALIAAGAPSPTAGGARPAPSAACPPQPVFVDCPPPGSAPDQVLDGFAFNKTGLDRRRHLPALDGLARRIAGSQRSGKAVRTVLIAGHTDPVGSDDYNFNLGWRRAREVLAELCRAIERQSPGLSARLRFELTSCGERQPKASAPASRRVEIFLRAGAPGSRKPVPPDHSYCGVPANAGHVQKELEHEMEELERSAPVQRPRPRLSLYQNSSTTSHRNHFRCQASRWARRIAAYGSPSATACPRRVGPTLYDSGADIIAAIDATRRCSRQPVEAVHIFSHSGSYGVFGSLSGGSVGLYSDALDEASRQSGGRVVSDVPAASLSHNVVFVLHGCNAAAGTDNLARALYQHLAATLRNPRVYGHYNSGCAGRDNSWREYSRRAPNGRRRSSIAPHYSGKGCCS